MEVLKIVGGLAAIAVVVAVIAMEGRDDGVETAAVAVPAKRSFEAQDSGARFVVPAPPPEEAAPGEAAPQD